MRGWSTPVTATAVTALVAAAMMTAPAASAGSRAASAPPAADVGGRPAAAAGDISTVAGGVGGPGKATNVAVGDPCGVAFSGGYLYAGDGYTVATTVRQVSLSNDKLTTAAGVGASGPLGNGGPATKASLAAACGPAFDHSGNLVIADYGHSQVRVVAAGTGTFYGQAMTAGHIYAVAGSGATGFAGDGGPATSAHLNGPYGVAVDAAGNLLIADSGNNRVRVVAASTGTFYGQAMTAGDIYTVAGGGTGGLGGSATKARIAGPMGVAVDPAGNLLIADGATGVLAVAASTGTFYGQAMTAGDIYRVAGGATSGGPGDGGPATKAHLWAYGVTTDGAGNLVIGDGLNLRVRVVASSTGTFYGQAMAAGDIYTVAGGGSLGLGDGGPATSAELGAPDGMAFDSAGNLLIADTSDNRVRVVAASTGTFYGQAMTAGDIYTVAGNGYLAYSGNGIPATQAELNGNRGVAGIEAAVSVDAKGNVLIADAGNNRVRVTAATSGTFYGQAMTAGDIYTVAGNGAAGFAGNTSPATQAQLNGPTGVAADAAGDLLIADQLNNRIRIVPASSGTLYGQAMTAGHIYSIAGGGSLSGNGVPATQFALHRPAGVAVDGAGNVLIAGNLGNQVYVVAASTGTFYGQAMTDGDIYTIAGNGTGGFTGDGGPATSAELRDPYGVAVDAAGNVLIAASGNNRVRVVAASTGTFYGQAMTAGDIYTIAGGGTSLGDGGPATSAELSAPDGVAVDGAGNVLIADTGNNRVRVVAASTGTFYGQAMTAGDIYTVAGNGKAGFFGDGGAGTSAWLNAPSGVAADGTNLVIADTGSNRIREVTG